MTSYDKRTVAEVPVVARDLLIQFVPRGDFQTHESPETVTPLPSDHCYCNILKSKHIGIDDLFRNYFTFFNYLQSINN